MQVSQLITKYHEVLKASDGPVPQEHNKSVSKAHRYYIELKKTKEGQEAITNLIYDPNPKVKTWAAAHSLEWAPKRARAVLEELRDGGGPYSFDAKWTLIEYDRKKLSFDY